jgi:CheY-like chemotaxis protein
MAQTTHRPHALIIEDELICALDLQAQLTDLGYGSFAFAGAELQALDQARLQRPDLVTVDVGLLDGDGLAAVDAILEFCGPLPVIYVTGNSGALVQRPDSVVLEKPVGAHALAAAVTRAKARPARTRTDGDVRSSTADELPA